MAMGVQFADCDGSCRKRSKFSERVRRINDPGNIPPATLRNSDFILGVPRDVPSTKGVILEIVALLNDAVSARRSRTLAECES
jgi:hypothetical protein